MDKVMIEEDKLLDLIDQMRVSVPKDVMEAKQLLQEKEVLVSEAQIEAKRVIAFAEEEQRAKLEETEVVKNAHARSQQIENEATAKGESLVAGAQRQATARVEEADGYALDVLRRLDSQLEQILQGVRKGMETLEEESEGD